MRRLILPLVLLATAAFAQTEIAVSTPRYGPAPGDQNAPKASTNGSDFLVAWNDDRGTAAVYAQRVKSDGTVLDGTGIRVADSVTLVDVFRTAGVYTLILTRNDVVFAASIDDDGALIEPLHTVMTGFYVRAAASNGTRIVLGDAYGVAILDARGHLLERNVLWSPMASWVGVGSNGSNFLLVTGTYANAHNSTHFTALDAGGRPTGTPSQLDDAAGGDRPVIASDGDDYLVVYLRNGGEEVAVNVDRDGVVKAVSALPNSMYFATGALQWSGSSYLLAAYSYSLNQTAVTTISRDGATVAAARALGPPTPGVQVPGMAWNGTEALIASTVGLDADPNGTEVVAALAGADGSARSAAFTIPSSAAAQRWPAIASGGPNDLVVWNEKLSDVYAARVTRGGAALDGTGILVAHDAYQPRIIFDGEAYLVAWLNNHGIHAQRIDATTGALLGNSTTLFNACAPSFDLGRDDASVLLVAADCSGHILAQRVGVAGPVGGPVPITPTDMAGGYPRMAWNGSEWLIAFDKLIPLPTLGPVPTYRGNVYAERLSSALAILDPQPIAIAVSPSTWNTSEWQPIVASDGRDFLVAWTRQWADADGTGMGVRTRAVHADGSLGDPVQFVEGPAYAHSIVSDGTRYAVAYDVQRADLSHQLELTHGTDRVAISNGPDQHDVALVLSGGTLRAAYARVAPEPVYGGVFRVFIRDLGPRRRAAGR